MAKQGYRRKGGDATKQTARVSHEPSLKRTKRLLDAALEVWRLKKGYSRYYW